MKLVIFGLTVSSSWGNGHATLWRGLLRALWQRGHQAVFFERDVPYYASTRDLHDPPGIELVLYPDWAHVRALAAAHLTDAEVAIVTSYCPDAVAATDLLLEAPRPLKVFYDLDTPVTLASLARREPVSYIGPRKLRDYDLVLSYTGGAALEALVRDLDAKRVAPLYGHVDPAVHHAAEPIDHFRCELSYLGTHAADRLRGLRQLFVDTAERRPESRFVLAGAQYPADFPWRANIWYHPHVAPAQHPAFFSSSRLTLNVTRRLMAEAGYCPSGRLFEAAACGVPMLSDGWAGLSDFFTPGREILVCGSTDDVLAAMTLTDEELAAVARAALERTLSEHTAECRARDLERLLESEV